MSSLKQKHLIGTGIIFIIGFIIPFLLKTKEESLNSVFSVSFTILGSLATIATLIVAILLYDRFGLSAKFKEKQAETVLELARLLKETHFTAGTNKLIYNLPSYRTTLSSLQLVEDYESDCKKILLFPNNFFENQLNRIFITGEKYWVPEEIKDKLKFLNIIALVPVENNLAKEYVRLIVNNSKIDEDWMQTVPKLTLEMFIINYEILLTGIESWLKKHTEVPVDLGF